MELELLHMDPKSKEAQVFYQLNNGSSNMAPIAAPSPSGNDDNIAIKLCLLYSMFKFLKLWFPFKKKNGSHSLWLKKYNVFSENFEQKYVTFFTHFCLDLGLGID
jgi:hypothetical protein